MMKTNCGRGKRNRRTWTKLFKYDDKTNHEKMNEELERDDGNDDQGMYEFGTDNMKETQPIG